MAGLLRLDTSIPFANLYLQIYLVFKNYNTVDIFQIAESSYFQFKKNSRLKHINNNLRIYTYSAIQLSNYLVDCVGLKKLILGLKGELKQDLLKIHYTDLFKQWENIKILNIFKKEFNIYAYHLRKTAGEEKDSIFQTIYYSLLQQVVCIDLEYYRHTIVLCTNNITCFIIYLSYALQFLNSHLPKKRNLEINLLRVYKGGPNFKESQLRSYISLIKEGSQSCIKLLPRMHQYILKWVDLLQEHRELNNREHIKNIKAAQTKANAKKFNFN